MIYYWYKITGLKPLKSGNKWPAKVDKRVCHTEAKKKSMPTPAYTYYARVEQIQEEICLE